MGPIFFPIKKPIKNLYKSIFLQFFKILKSIIFQFWARIRILHKKLWRKHQFSYFFDESGQKSIFRPREPYSGLFRCEIRIQREKLCILVQSNQNFDGNSIFEFFYWFLNIFYGFCYVFYTFFIGITLASNIPSTVGRRHQVGGLSSIVFRMYFEDGGSVDVIFDARVIPIKNL